MKSFMFNGVKFIRMNNSKNNFEYDISFYPETFIYTIKIIGDNKNITFGPINSIRFIKRKDKESFIIMYYYQGDDIGICLKQNHKPSICKYDFIHSEFYFKSFKEFNDKLTKLELLK